MPAIDESNWKFKEMQTRPFGEVRKGYTHFADGDVLFAKITPCMENGKAAIARNLVNGIGCGTTELHVLRPEAGIPPEFIYHYIHQESFRERAAASMTGTAGQLTTLPITNKSRFEQIEIPLTSLPEQQEIVRRVEALFKFADEVEKRVEEAKKWVEKVSQSILARAFSGELTADFREAVKNWRNLGLEERKKYIFTLPEEEQGKVLEAGEFPLEPAERLLERIQEEFTKRELKRRSIKAKGKGQDQQLKLKEV
jgi:type I restriction enzyme S subunit